MTDEQPGFISGEMMSDQFLREARRQASYQRDGASRREFIGLTLTMLTPLLIACGSTESTAPDPARALVWSQALSGDYNGIWGTSASDVWAVGLSEGFTDLGLISHYNGTSWSTLRTDVSEVLTDVWGSSPSDVWAVGYGGT